MPAKKSSAVDKAATKAAAAKTKASLKTTAKPKSTATPKKTAAAKTLLTLKPKKNPKNLDRLYIPGMTEDIEHYDAGIAAWLFAFGVTIQVDRNWVAQPGDLITVGKLINPTTVEPLAIKKLEPGEEAHNHYFFSVDQKDLPDGPYALVYVVNYGGGAQYDMSYALETLVKTDLPAGEDKDQIEPGHSGLHFSVSESVIVQGNAHSVKVTVQPYENLNPTDQIILHWGQVTITQQVAGPLLPTVIAVTYQDIVDGGDSDRFEVWFEVIDLVGNASTPGSASVFVSVTLDQSRCDGPVLFNAGPLGYVDLEVLAERPLELQVRTPRDVGLAGDIYDVTCRFYPPKGGLKVVHKFVPITTPGRAYSVFFDNLDVRAAAGARIDTSFILRRSIAPFEIYSKKTTAQVRGSLPRLEAPFIEGYPTDVIADNPDYVIATIPYYPLRQATDQISLYLRYVRALGDTVIYPDKQVVGPSVPAGAPVKRVINRKDLQMFKGLQPELFYVISPGLTRARAVDLNESLRRVLTVV